MKLATRQATDGLLKRLAAARAHFGSTGLLVRVVALVSLGLGIVLVGFALLGAQSIRDTTERTLEERLAVAQVTARSMDDWLVKLASLAASEAARLPLDGVETGEEAGELWRALRMQLGPGVVRTAVVDASGRLLWSAPEGGELKEADLAENTALRRALQSGEVGVYTAGQDPFSKAPTRPREAALLVFAPIAGPRGGVVILELDIAQQGANETLRHIVPGQTGYAEIVSDEGVVMATTRPSRLGISSDYHGHFGNLIRDGSPKVSTCHSCHDDSGTVSVHEEVLAIAPLSSAPLAVSVRQDAGEAFALADILFQRSLVFGVVSFLVALGVSATMVVKLVRPVKTLTDACQRIAEGDLSRPIPRMGGGEMTVLAGSFEMMRARLDASQARLQQWGQQLETEVALRTAELRQARDELERSRDYLVSLFNSLEDELAVIDQDYQIVVANRALQRRWQSEGTVVGGKCHKVFHNEDRPCDRVHYGCPTRMVWQTGQPARATHRHTDHEGKTTYHDIVASPIVDGRGKTISVLEVSRDITHNQRLEEQVLRTSRELATLVSLTSTIACSMDLEAVLGTALDQVLGLLDVKAGAIFVEGAEGEPHITVSRGLEADSLCRPTVAGQDTQPDNLTSGWEGIGLLRVPITGGGDVLGEIALCRPNEHWPSDTGGRLLTSIGSQLAVAIENARLYDALMRKDEMLSAFVRKYIAAQEDERKRIARELHDETAQSLTALSMAIETVAQTRTGGAADVGPLLQPARLLTERVSREIERIIRDLRPTLLDDLGLLEALGWYADNRLKPLGIIVTIETVGDEARLSPELETALFRVGQEAMSNITRHAGAENVSLVVEFGHDAVGLDVEDDGCGFDVERVLAGGGNLEADSPFGLLGMRERVELLGGTLDVESRPGQGTRVAARVPLRAY